MHIVVCTKQVPASAQMRVHPVNKIVVSQAGRPNVQEPFARRTAFLPNAYLGLGHTARLL